MEFACEEFSDSLLNELFPLFQIHYEEVEPYLDIPFDPDVTAYKFAAANKFLKVFTIRVHDILMGYALFFVRGNPHNKDSVQAVQDAIFLHKKIRAGMAASKFIRWCDQQLRNAGVQAVYQHVKMKKNFSRILERQGYKLLDLVYSKRLDKEW